MRSRFTLGAAIAILVIIAAVAWYFQPQMSIFIEDFEEDLGGWIGDADVPVDPNTPGSNVEWNVSRVNSLAQAGQSSVKLYIDGRQDDGTVWIEKGFLDKRNSQIQVTISFDFYSKSESFNVIAAVVGFVGTYNPEVEADFAVIGQANEVSGWKTYSHTSTFDTGSSGEVWIAAGISVRWETEMVYNLDNVKVEIG